MFEIMQEVEICSDIESDWAEVTKNLQDFFVYKSGTILVFPDDQGYGIHRIMDIFQYARDLVGESALLIYYNAYVARDCHHPKPDFSNRHFRCSRNKLGITFNGEVRVIDEFHYVATLEISVSDKIVRIFYEEKGSAETRHLIKVSSQSDYDEIKAILALMT